MASTWRKRKGSAHDTWHFCRNCTNWPTHDYDERMTKPTTGELCDQCKGKQAQGNCG